MDYKFVIFNKKTNKPVQNWSFATKKHVVYCETLPWAMKFEKGDGALRTAKYLMKNFPGTELVTRKVSIGVSIKLV